MIRLLFYTVHNKPRFSSAFKPRFLLFFFRPFSPAVRQPKCSATVGNDLSPDTSTSFFEANESHSQSAMEKSLLVAIALGQYETVRATLERSSPDLDYQDAACDGNSALHLAVLAKHNKTRLIELLIEAGADCDLRNHDDLTPVELALANGSQYVAEFALSRELDGVPDGYMLEVSFGRALAMFSCAFHSPLPRAQWDGVGK